MEFVWAAYLDSGAGCTYGHVMRHHINEPAACVFLSLVLLAVYIGTGVSAVLR